MDEPQWFHDDEFDVVLTDELAAEIRRFYGDGPMGVDFAQALASFIASPQPRLALLRAIATGIQGDGWIIPNGPVQVEVPRQDKESAVGDYLRDLGRLVAARERVRRSTHRAWLMPLRPRLFVNRKWWVVLIREHTPRDKESSDDG